MSMHAAISKAGLVFSLAAIGLIVGSVQARAQQAEGLGYWRGVTPPVFSGPITVPDSTCAAPTLHGSDADTGVALTATPTMLDCVNGAAVGTWAPGLLSVAGAVAVPAGTITANAPGLNVTQTWNNAGVTFNGAVVNITSTASASASTLFDLQLAGVSLFNFRKDGTLILSQSSVNAVGFLLSTSGGSLQILGKAAFIATSPSISSGFGTSPSVTSANGTAAFTVNVGTGGTATQGVLTMPAATTGYNCHVENRTGVAANRANQRTVQRATTTTSVTVENQTISTGAALAWTASDVLALMCMAY